MKHWYNKWRAEWRNKHIELLRAKHAEACGKSNEAKALLVYAESDLAALDPQLLWFPWAVAMQRRADLKEQVAYWQRASEKYREQIASIEQKGQP